MTREEAANCMRSQTLNDVTICIKCPHFMSVQRADGYYTCKADEAFALAIRSLEAWDEVKKDLSDLWLEGYSPYTEVMEIIDRHLKEVEDDKIH